MIALTRTASIAPGKTSSAVAYSHQIAKYIKEKHGTTLEVLMPVGGNPARIAWHARYENLGQWETLTGELLADMEYMAFRSTPTCSSPDRSTTASGGFRSSY